MSIKLNLKLYAGLRHYLPEDAQNQRIKIDIAASDGVYDILDRYQVPTELVHLVLLNGIYLKPTERQNPKFKNGDTLAIWPPVAGG